MNSYFGGLVMVRASLLWGLIICELLCIPWREQEIVLAEEQKKAVPTVVKLSIKPMATPRPALKYRLLPTPLEKKAGNAAVFYYRALPWAQGSQNTETMKEYEKNSERWLKQPSTPELRAEMKQWLEKIGNRWYHQIHEATYRDECRFDFRLQDLSGPPVVEFLLPEMQAFRTLGRQLQVRTRLAITEARYDDALESLHCTMQLGQACNSEKLLICGLIGAAITSTTIPELEAWIASPESPNLYWALATLPQPVLDFRPSMEFERRLPEMVLPVLKQVETAQRTPEEWRTAVEELLSQMDAFTAGAVSKESKQNERAAFDQLVETRLPAAREALIESGVTREKVESMAPGQVLLWQTKNACRYMGDEFTKGAYLPASQQFDYYRELEARLQSEGYMKGPKEPIPLASILLPAIQKVLQTQTRLDRDFKAVQALEAIRAHASSTHELPENLTDITATPVPNNPFTNAPFEYFRQGNTAELKVHQPDPQVPALYNKVYQIELTN
jgi:hypothetical protein